MNFDEVPALKVPVPPHPREDIFNAVVRDRGSYIIPSDLVCEELGYSVREGKSILRLVARQGGGNDKCWCETEDDEHEADCLWKSNRDLETLPGFLNMEYDPYDPTYNYFYFELNMDEYTYTEQEEARHNALDINRLVDDRDFILAHNLPHSLLGNNPKNKFNEYKSLLKKISEKEDEEADTQKSIEKLQQSKERIFNGLGTDTDFVNISSLYQVQKHIQSKIEDYHRKLNDNANAQKVEEEINNLPEGSALKEVLLRDRGTFTYTKKEVPPGKRRAVKRTVTAKHSTKAESLLKDMVTKDYVLDEMKEQIFREIDPLSKKISMLKRTVNKYKDDEKKIAELKKELGFDN